MNPDELSRDRQARDVFLRALDKSDPTARAAFLEGACGVDLSLRSKVDALLTHHMEDSFLEEAAVTALRQAGAAEPLFRDAVGMTIGRFKLLQQIGEGGCGVVYLAEQMEPVRRRVALKVIKLGMDTCQVITRFEAERQALAMMDHPNIAKVLDAGATDTGRPYFVMELVRGTKITDYCDQHQLPTSERLKLFVQVCQAIQHAHQKGIIHRDVKPSNVLVTVNEGMAVPKVIDFGIAKATAGQPLTERTLFTALDQLLGTPAYMSPEQTEMTSLDIDTRTDIYSLGVLLYELLTGKTPFDPKQLLAAGLDEMRRTIREHEPLRPSTRVGALRPDELTTTAQTRGLQAPKLISLLRGDLDWIVMKALEKDRARRYQTGNDLGLDILRHLNQEPVIARPPSRFYRFEKLVRRNKLLCAAAGMVLSSMLMGLSITSWEAVVAIRARKTAETARRSEEQQRRAAQAAQLQTEAARRAEQRLREQAQEQEARTRRIAYAAEMNLVQRALELNNIGQAAELLERNRPRVGQEDLRGWEWRYLWQFIQSDAQSRLGKLTNGVVMLSISQDGKLLLAVPEEESPVALFDLEARRRIPIPWGKEPVALGAFSPAAALVAIVSRFQDAFRLRLVDTSSGKVRTELDKWAKAPNRIVFSDDGNTIAVLIQESIESSFVEIWRVADGQRMGRYASSSCGCRGATGALSFALSPDGTAMVAPGPPPDDFGIIRVSEVSSNTELWKTRGGPDLVTVSAFSPGGRILATGLGYAEGTIRLWDARTGQDLGQLEGHRGWPSALLYLDQGRTLASASADQTIRLWDVEKLKGTGVLNGHRAEVWSLVATRDHKTLISGGQDGEILLWDRHAVGQRRPMAVIANVIRWRFAANGHDVIALHPGPKLIRWSGTWLDHSETILELSASIGKIVLSSDGSQMVSVSTNGEVLRYNLEARPPVASLILRENAPSVVGLVPAKDLLILSRQSTNGTLVEVRRLEDGTLRRSFRLEPDELPLLSSPDGNWLCARLAKGSRVYDLRNGWPQGDVLVHDTAYDTSFSKDGRYFAIAGEPHLAQVWELPSLRRVAGLSGHRQGPKSIGFSPDNKRIATSSAGDEALKVWEEATQLDLLTLEAQGSYRLGIRFSPNGNLLGAMNGQGQLHVWRAPSWEEIAAAEAAVSRAQP